MRIKASCNLVTHLQSLTVGIKWWTCVYVCCRYRFGGG